MRVYRTYSRDFGDFGRVSFLTRARNIISNPLQRAGSILKTTAGDIKKGNILKAVAISNPFTLVTQLVTSNEHAINIARVTMPTSVAAISDKSLRKKAAIGWAVAAVVATGVGLAAGAAGAGSAAAAEGTAAGAESGLAVGSTGLVNMPVATGMAEGSGGLLATGAGSAGGGLFATIMNSLGLAQAGVGVAKSTGLLKGKDGGGSESGVAYADDGSGQDNKPGFFDGMGTPQNILLFSGAAALTIALIKLSTGKKKPKG